MSRPRIPDYGDPPTEIHREKSGEGDDAAAGSGDETDPNGTGGPGRVSVETSNGEMGAALALVIAAVGLIVGSPVLLVGATIPLWYVAAASLAERPETRISVQRDLAVESESVDATRGTGDNAGEALAGDPGEVVTVRTTVRNVGSMPAIDLRVADGVPDALPVVEGTPRACVTLATGEATTVEYGVELQRGEHVFDAPSLRAHDLTGLQRADWDPAVAGDDRLVCSPAVDEAPLGEGRNDYAGEVPTDEGGSGVEFHSIRDYEPGDPVRSIDWRRYANTRDLATVEYRAERSTRNLCVVDARMSQSTAPVGSELSTLELCAGAAERTAGRLLSEGHPTGTATLYRHSASFVAPGTDSTTRQRVTGLLQSLGGDDGGTTARELGGDPVESLPRVIAGETQVYLFSSLVDDKPLELIERLRSQGYSVCVVSPDVTGGAGGAEEDDVASLGTRVTGIERDNRLARARATGATVVEWELDRSLGLVLDRAVGVVGR